MSERCEHCDGLLHKNNHSYCRDQIFIKTHPIQCPKCQGRGTMDDPTGKTKTIEVSTNNPSCAYNGCRGCHWCYNSLMPQEVPVTVPCNLCDGHGRLEKEPVPITKVVDWQKQ